MKVKFGIGDTWIESICLALIAVIFIADASTPSGYGVSFLYILPALICIVLPNDRTIYGVALIATVLTIIAVPFEPSQTLSIDLFNRAASIVGIWIIVLFGIQRKSRKFEREIEKKLVNSLMLIGSWKSLECSEVRAPNYETTHLSSYSSSFITNHDHYLDNNQGE